MTQRPFLEIEIGDSGSNCQKRVDDMQHTLSVSFLATCSLSSHNLHINRVQVNDMYVSKAEHG